MNIEFAMKVRGCPKKYLTATLDDFYPSIAETIQKLEYDSPENEGNGLYIYGKKGSGKTHLMCSIIRGLLSRGDTKFLRFHFITAMKMMMDVKRSFGPNPEYTEYELFEFYAKDTDYLFIDDLGAEQITDWSRSFLDLIVNERYGEMKPTFFSSNYNLIELEKIYGDRIPSRIQECCELLRLSGKNRRIEK